MIWNSEYGLEKKRKLWYSFNIEQTHINRNWKVGNLVAYLKTSVCKITAIMHNAIICFWCSLTYKHENMQLHWGNFSLRNPATQNTCTDVLINSYKKIYKWHRTYKRRLWFNLTVMKTDFSTRSCFHQLRAVTHDIFLWIMSAWLLISIEYLWAVFICSWIEIVCFELLHCSCRSIIEIIEVSCI